MPGCSRTSSPGTPIFIVSSLGWLCSRAAVPRRVPRANRVYSPSLSNISSWRKVPPPFPMVGPPSGGHATVCNGSHTPILSFGVCSIAYYRVSAVTTRVHPRVPAHVKLLCRVSPVSMAPSKDPFGTYIQFQLEGSHHHQ
ncbi:hypothetical protein BDY19DRAFT_474359 [Irpex rosettiformis]|uniref:Uncharacterized protein n=1 Tax=Irpex rosettiformis TaxID=378272 RepID=A0ACB8TSE0_9APHY|nr:hypothetical protein BDY19DRAFT_474359 [Irpex rosettiformis]